MIPFKIKSTLNISTFYNLFGVIIGAAKARSIIAVNYIRAKPHDRVLDIGCGTAEIIDCLPEVEYVGFDANAEYIQSATKRFAGKGTFFCKNISTNTVTELKSFDIALALGVLHHLSDEEVLALLQLSKNILKENGRLITIDGCFTQKQSPITRWLLSNDRGEFVRTESEYTALARKIFPDIKVTIRTDLLNIPYTHIIMECTN